MGDSIPNEQKQIASTSEPRFVGSITRVNLWNRVLDFEQEIPTIVQRCQGSPLIHKGVVLRFAGYDLLEGKVERIVKSTCGREDLGALTSQSTSSSAASSSSSSMKETDEEQVRVDFCPSDLFVVTPLKEVNVTWSEPQFSIRNRKNSVLRAVEQNLKPGQVFTWGEYNVLYVAYSNSSSLAECSFKVRGKEYFKTSNFYRFTSRASFVPTSKIP